MATIGAVKFPALTGILSDFNVVVANRLSPSSNSSAFIDSTLPISAPPRVNVAVTPLYASESIMPESFAETTVIS